MSNNFYKWEVVFERSKSGGKTVGGMLTISFKIPFDYGESGAVDEARQVLIEEIGADKSHLYQVRKIERIG